MEKSRLEELIRFRKKLHKHPELSQHERNTKKRILRQLRSFGFEHPREIGHTGVLVDFDSRKPGKTIMLRADTDALPIREVNDFEHRSVHDGVSHKCGHDGHTTILLGVAAELIRNPLQNGRVLLVFQPAEENGEGAKAILADEQFDMRPDMVFALHNLPGYPLHQVVIKEGPFTAAAKSIIIKLEGKTSHAAEPEAGISPASAIADLITLMKNESQPDINRDDFALATPVFIHMGEKSYGVSAGHGEVHYTLRTWTNQVMQGFSERLENRVASIAKMHRLNCFVDWTEEFFSNQNDGKAVALIEKAANVNELNVVSKDRPFKWGEDFGLFTERFSGAMFGLGAGEDSPALHNPDYDFPDELIPTGINMFVSIINESLNA
jgi:amidohydrolase